MSGIDAPVDDAGRLDALICFSHLRWSFVWQRPQHILTRLAYWVDVIVVEEPESTSEESAPTIGLRAVDGLTVLTPLMPDHLGLPWGFNDDTNPVIATLLGDYLAARGLRAPDRRLAVWYYTPMALGAFPEGIPVDVAVYDVMDELANFKGAPVDLKSRERAMLDHADLVFAGGPSLFLARERRHPSVHCFPSGVEASHFATARLMSDIPSDMTGIPRPIIGFYGVIDERLDLNLLEAVADQRPNWSIVMIGPVVKIDPADLPVRTNLHYLGKRDYPQLPAYLAAFDVAILPFAINEATRFISPTKTLEYLASGAPVVSTPIVDVISLYGDVVAIADDARAFVEAVDGHLSESPSHRTGRRRRAAEILVHHEWNAIAGRMMREIEATVGSGVPSSRPARELEGAPAD